MWRMFPFAERDRIRRTVESNRLAVLEHDRRLSRLAADLESANDRRRLERLVLLTLLATLLDLVTRFLASAG